MMGTDGTIEELLEEYENDWVMLGQKAEILNASFFAILDNVFQFKSIFILQKYNTIRGEPRERNVTGTNKFNVHISGMTLITVQHLCLFAVVPV